MFGWSGNGAEFVSDIISYDAGYSGTVTFDGSNTGGLWRITNDNASGGTLKLDFQSGTALWLNTAANRNSIRFRVGGEVFDAADASWDSADKVLTWSSSGLTWAAMDSIPVHIEKKVTATDSCETGNLWCTTLTVGASSTLVAGQSARGYCDTASGVDWCGYGSVSDDDFLLDGTTYTVESIRWSARVFSSNNRLHLTLDQEFPAASLASLTLKVRSEEFALDGLNASQGSTDSDSINYRWQPSTFPSAIKGLNVGDVVRVQMLGEESTPTEDATLSGLAVETARGGYAVDLTPTFASGTTSYSGSAASTVRKVTVTATKSASSASVTISPSDGDADTTGHQVSLSAGSNAVTVTVVDGSTTGAYTVAVTRADRPPVPTCDSDELWCATMTAGSTTTAPTTRFGWESGLHQYDGEGLLSASDDLVVPFEPGFTGNLGSISNNNAGGGTLVVYLGRGSWLDTEANRNSVSLRIGSDTFAFADASYSADKFLTWTNSGLTWAVYDLVDVSFVLAGTGTPATGQPRIQGIPQGPQHGLTLTSDTNQIMDADGLASPGYTYQWIRVGTPDVNISGATASTYTVTAADVGKQLKLKVDFTDDDSNPETRTSDTTVTVAAQSAIRFASNPPPVTEGGQVTATLNLTPAARGSGTVPLVATGNNGAGGADFDLLGGNPLANITSISFSPGNSSQQFNVEANDDGQDDDGESVTIALGALPPWMTLGTLQEITIDLVDNDDPHVIVSFGASEYTASESGTDAVVTVTLSAEPERQVVLTITKSHRDGATASDYSGVPATVTFASTQTIKTFTVSATDDMDNDDGEGVLLAFGTPLPSRVTTGTPAGTTVNITDDDGDEVTVSFGTSSYTATEGGTGAVVVVSLSQSTTVQVVVPVTHAAQGGATAQGTTGEDYSGVPGSMTFGVGTTSLSFTVVAENDTVDDDDESVLLGFGTLPAGIGEGSTADATVTLADDDDPSALSFGDVSATEGSPVTFTVSLSPVSGKTVTVGYATSVGTDDTASSGDFTTASGTLTFEPGETTKSVTVATTPDTTDEDNETFTLTLSNVDNATLPSDASATGTINDDDSEGALSVQDASATEGSAINFQVTAPSSGKTVTVDYATSVEPGDTASSGDFTAASGTLTFMPGETTKSVTVATTPDTTDEDNETFTLTLSNVDNAMLPSDASATGTINDNDNAPSLSFGDASAAEGSPVTFTVALSAASGKTVTVMYATSVASGNTASSGDFTAASGTLTFEPGDTTKPVPVTTTQDETDEDDETFTLTLSSASNAALPSDRTKTGTITNDDSAGALSVQDGSAEEGDVMTFTVTAPASGKTVTVMYATSVETGDTALSGTDFTAKSGTLRFVSGTEPRTRTVTVSTREDTADEDDETFTLTLSDPTNATLPTPATATGTITDDDNPPTLSFVDASAIEGAPVTFTVSLSAASGKTVTVDYLTSVEAGDTASSGDFTAAPGTLTFAPGATTGTVAVTTTHDTTDEDDETFTLTLSNANNATLPADTDKMGMITDNDSAPTLALAVDDNEINEGDATLTVVLTASISGSQYAEDQEVTLSFSGTATEGASSDYAVSRTSLTLAKETGNASATATVTVYDDAIDEAVDRETIVVALKLDGTTVDTVTITVVDDDTRGLALSLTQVDITETDGNATEMYTVALTSEPTESVTVTLSVTGVNSLTTLPLVNLASLTFTPSNWSTARQVTVTAPADEDAEDESAAIDHTVSSGGDYSAMEDEELGVAVDDDELASTRLTLSANPGTVREGAGPTAVVVTATLDQGAYKEAGTIRVDLERPAATEAADYTAPASVTLTLAAQSGSVSATIMIEATDDLLWEADEEVLLEIGRLGGAFAGVNLGLEGTEVVLESDDAEPELSFTASASEMAEAGGSAELVVAITNGVGFEAEQTVSLGFTGGTATPGTDYTQSPSGGSLTLAAGVVSASATLTLTARDDTVDEDDGTAGLDDEDERIVVRATHMATGGTEELDTRLEVAILDDDHPGVSVYFNPTSYTAAEGGPTAVVVLVTYSSVSGDNPEREIVIPITQTLTGGATRQDRTKADYSGVPASVTILASGLPLPRFTVTVFDDQIDDDGEGVELGFGPLPDDKVMSGIGATATVGFTDNDERGFEFVYPEGNAIPEAGNLFYSLALTSEPTANVTVTFDAHPRKGTVLLNEGTPQAISSLTFTPSNWTTARDLILIVNSDSNSVTEMESIGHRGSGGDYAGYRQGLAVTIIDDDAAASGVLLQAAPAAVGEGDGPTSVVVRATLDGAALGTATTVSVTVGEGTASSTDYTANPGTLAIVIPADTAQASGTFTLTPNDDGEEEDDETVTLSGTSALPVSGTTVTIEDDDTRGVTVSTSLLELDEGDSRTYTVRLNSAPSGPVTVTVESDTASVTANPAELTFTATDYGARAVTVTAAQDADSTNDRVSITHAVSGADYGANNVSAPTVTVLVNDDEEGSSGVLLAFSPATVSEGAGATPVEVTARLDGGALGQAVTVQATLAAGTALSSDYRLDRSRLSLTIPAGELAVTLTVTLTPVDDAVDENDETLSVEGTASNGFPVTGARLTIEDDDTRGVTVTPTALALDEQSSGMYTVALDSAPTGSVTVELAVTGDGEASVRVSPGSLVFTSSDHEAKTVTVSARGDRDQQGGRVTVAHAVTGADYVAETASSVTVNVTDTGIVEWDVELSVDDVSPLAEEGGARRLMVTAELLTGLQPAAVPVSVTVSGQTALSSDFRASPASFTLTIPAGQDRVSRQVTVTPTDDGIDENDETLVVAPRVADHLTTNEGGVVLTIVDNDTRGVTVAPTVLSLAEGARGSYTVSLGSQPNASVTVSVTLGGSDSVTASRSSLVFTGSNWRRAQAVTVTAAQDMDPNDERVTITHVVTGGDYAGETAASVSVTAEDDDKPSTKVTLSAPATSVAEGGGARSVTVTGRLDGAPEAQDVTVTLSAGGGTASSSDYMAAAVVLTITAGQTETRAAFTVEPTDDGVDEDDETLTVSGALSSGQALSVEPAAGLTVTIVDDDERGVTVTPTALTVAEGESRSYEVALGSEPAGSVRVTVRLSDDDGNRMSGATTTPSSLTFTAADWRMAQTVTVDVSDDSAVEADATATIAHAVSGADYGTNNVTASSVTVSVSGYELNAEGDGVLLLVADGAVTVPSGTPAPTGLSLALPARLDRMTVEVREVAVPGDDPQGFRVGDTVVDIDGVDLGSGETATVCLPSAEDGELSVWGWDETNLMWVELDEPPGGSPSGRACGVTDHFSVFGVMVRLEEPELVFSEEALTVTIGEEEGATYTVALGLQPAGAVTVAVSGHEGTELSVTPVMLVFTEGDWNLPQAVTATVSEEAEPGSEAELTHTASGGRYLAAWEATLEVTVERDSGLLQRAREAWLARFGRTVAGHVAEAVAQRLSAPAGQETQLALGGAQPRQALVAGVLQTLAGESPPDGRRMLANSAFVLPLWSDGEQSWTAWGRGAYTEFDGEEDELKLDGEVSSGTLGVDVERGDWRLGLALSHSEGEGDIREADGDRYELESSLTGAYPYARWQLDETISVWGVLGYGEGELEQERDGERTETDLEMRMAAFGARGALGEVELGSGTFDLSLKSDLLAVRVEADADAELPEVEADAQRVRLLLEGAGHCRELDSGGVLAPTLEAGLRWDEGDAETGLGVELGAGVRYADGSGRLSAELTARGLLAHEESGYEEWGVSGALRLDPDASGRGLSLKLESALGVTGSGTDELWTRRDLSGLARDDDFEAAGRFRAEMGLGLNAPGGLGSLTPYVGYERTDSKSIWHLGGRLKAGPDLAIGLEAAMHRGDDASDGQELKLNLSGRW